MNMGTHTS